MKTKFIGFRISVEEMNVILSAAKKENRSISNYCLTAVLEKVNKEVLSNEQGNTNGNTVL
jgi:uncharacterized protein (DUF1778 family)